MLGVNIDHVATVRQARGEEYPDILDAARLCEECDIYCITAHLREDRRHIQDEDIYKLKKSIRTRLNLEMSLAPEIVDVALDVVPYMATLVPEKREELTTEGGLDLAGNLERVKSAVTALQKKGIVVSLFVEPDPEIIPLMQECGVEYAEFHTGSYANSTSDKEKEHELNRLYKAAEVAGAAGIHVNAGHGLNYTNIHPVLGMKNLRELNIGHSIVSRALYVGLKEAVAEMLALIKGGESKR